MYVVAMTGMMGSGKSTAMSLFASHGANVFKTDDAARSLMEPGLPVYEAIKARFPMVCESGAINRVQLADIVFANQSDKAWLESLVHPLVREQIVAWAARDESSYGVIEIPVFTEENRLPCIQRVCMVDAPKELCHERVKERDGRSDHLISLMLAQQLSRDSLLALADDVLFNQGEKALLVDQVATMHTLYSIASKSG